MATEKYFCFDEQGELKRIKGRLVRFLDNEAPTGSDKSAIRTSLEVSPDAEGLVQADVGTAPNEIPVNGMLGDLAYQDADSVSAGTVSADEIGIGTSSPNAPLAIVTSGNGTQFEASDGTVTSQLMTFGGTASFGTSSTHDLKLMTAGSERWRINSTGNLVSSLESQAIDLSGSNYAQLKLADNVNYALQVGEGANPYVRFDTTNSAEKIEFYKNLYMSGNIEFGSGNGIDFSATADGAGSSINEILSDYETGTWSPAYETETANMTTPPTMDIVYARYVRVGGLVHVQAYIRTDSVDTTGGSGNLIITGLPFAPHSSSYSSVDISFASHWGTNYPLAGYTYPGIGITLQKRTAANGETTSMSASDLTNGATTNQNRLIFKASYYTTA